MRVVHTVFTDYTEHGYGWDISSPQVAGLSAGRRTAIEALACVDEILSLAGLEPGSYERIDHEQKYAVSPAGLEYLIRFVVNDLNEPDDHTGVRGSTVGRELHSATSGLLDLHADAMPRTVTGERIVIAVRRDDSLGWVLDQLSGGDGATLSYYAGEDAVWALPIADAIPQGWTLDELSLSRDSSVGDLMDNALAAEAHGLTAHLATALV